MIYYEDLVFPQVEALPRDLPLILPLGGCRRGHEKILGDQNAILLPAIPYGFEAPLELDLEPVIASLLEFLREDGFTDVRLLGQRGYCGLPLIPYQAPAMHIHGGTAIVPIGHTEQHGFHLPLSTDSLIADSLARQLKLEPPQTRLLVWPYGVSTHRRQYPGTLSLNPRVFEDFLTGLAGRLAPAHGVIYFLNGHGGNHSFLVNVCKFAGEQLTHNLTATTFLHTASGQAEASLKQHRQSQLMGHACELETSYILHLKPELVRMQWVVDEPNFIESPNYKMDWTGEGALILNPPWSDDTRTGSYGHPSLASAARGQLWMEAAAREIESQIQELNQQLQRRRQRRSEGWVEGAWREQWRLVTGESRPLPGAGDQQNP
ncbi:creatininase family protein [bacterium]|nr:creatininase family protein [bacterium]